MNFERTVFTPTVERQHDVSGNVDDQMSTGGDAADDSENRLELAKKELLEMRRKAQGLIDCNRFNFELFAESAAPKFIFSDGFYMLFEKKEVHMDTKWFFDREFSNEQLVWATYHELAHFYDFAEDHRALLRKFEDIDRQAKEMGKLLADKFRESVPSEHADRYAKYLVQEPIDPKRPERGTMNHFDRMARGIHHEFWNIADDIYVNSLVAKRKSAYGEGGAYAEEVKRLYREQLFKESDFSALPRYKQYAYALIRRAMVPDEEVNVNDEVREALDRKLLIGGKEKIADEIVRGYIQSSGSVGRKAGARYLTVEISLEQVFQELLLKDIADWEPKFPDDDQDNRKEEDSSDNSGEEKESDDEGGDNESGKSENNQNGDDSEGEEGDDAESGQGGEEAEDGKEKQGSNGSLEKSMKENIDDAFNPTKNEDGHEGKEKPGKGGGNGPIMPRPIQSPEDLKNILDVLNEGKKEWQEAKDQEEKEKKKEMKSEEDIKNELDVLRAKQFADRWAKEFDMTPEDFERALREYEETEKKIRPHLAALDVLWQRIIYGRSRENVTESSSRFKTGIDIDIDEVVQQYPEIHTGDLEKVRVMTRTETVREFVERPELIRVRFVGDGSESMDNERREILKQAFVLVSTSLRRFETFLNLSRGRTKSKLSADTEAWIFGSEASRVKSFRGKSSRYEREKASIVAVFAGLGENRGGTRDDKALAAIDASITHDEAWKIKAKKIMEIIFELTDGGTNREGIVLAKRALANLDQKGVISRAFQIGTTDKSEQAIFENVWNTDDAGRVLPVGKRRGHIVGSELKNLIPALTESLASYLGHVEL